MLAHEIAELRRTGLGGTDMVAIVGCSHFRAPIDVYLEKRGDIEGFTGNERTDWGQILEPVIARHWASETGLVIQECPPLRSTARPWQTGSPDRLVYDPERMAIMEAAGTGSSWSWPGVERAEDGAAVGLLRPDGGLEIKSHGWYASKAYDEESVPDDKRIQCAWYMSLCDLDSWELAALFDTHLFRRFVVRRDREVEDYLLEEGEIFWRRIQNGNPPPPDGSDSFSRYLAQKFNDGVEIIQATPEQIEMIEEYRAAHAEAKAAEVRKEIAGQTIKAQIGSSMGLGFGKEVLATWKRDSKGRTDWKALAMHLVEVAGVTDSELEELKAKFEGEPPRKLNVRKAKR